jgi:DNA-binding transcriptional MerR regulator
MRGIGATAQATGLSVSALRFYDRAGLLVPAAVDPGTGYRWYAPEQIAPARLLAGLRRLGMPLADVRRALDAWPDRAVIRRLTEEHLGRLEAGLADARRELSRVHALLDREETPMTVTVRLPGTALAAALAAVRFAVGTDPELPVLTGVLFEMDGATLRLVATDRYRMAVAAADAVVTGPPTAVVVPADFVDELRPLLTGADVVLTADTAIVTAAAGEHRLTGRPLDQPFPDYRRALGDRLTVDGDTGPGDGPDGRRRTTVDTATLRAALASGRGPVLLRERDGVEREVVALRAGADGPVRVVDGDAAAVDPDGHVGVDREFLLEAVDAGGGGQLVLELDGPIRPLAIRPAGAARSMSILMPIRLS